MKLTTVPETVKLSQCYQLSHIWLTCCRWFVFFGKKTFYIEWYFIWYAEVFMPYIKPQVDNLHWHAVVRVTHPGFGITC